MSAQRIYISSPDVGAVEEEYIINALRSGWVAPLGPDVDAFENEMAKRAGVEHAVALSSGTAALHLGLLALGVGVGDIVLTSTLTFAATANAITYCGAEPIFVDCELKSGNMDPELLRQAIKDLRSKGHSIAAILPVDLLGRAVNYTELAEVSKEFGIPVLADAAESLGALHKGRPTGGFGEASIFSFNGNKVMTTSGGGMLLTSRREIAEKVRYLATQARQPVVHYEHTDIGYNYRMSNLLAALGRAQLSRLDSMIAKRRALRERYKDLIGNISGVQMFQGEGDSEDNCWLTALLVDSKVTGWTPVELAEFLAQDNIESRPLWKPMHLQPVFKGKRSYLNGNSQQLFERGLTLPSGSALAEIQIVRVMDRLKDFFQSKG